MNATRARPAIVVFTLVLAGCLSVGPVETSPSPTKTPPPRDGTWILGGGNASANDSDSPTDPFANFTGMVLPIGGPTFEPTIGATKSGALFMTSYRGTGDGTHIFRSRDQGRNWTDVGPFLSTTDAGQVPTSNDPYVHVDRFTDAIYKFDMHGLACMTLETSKDEGKTWSPPTPACGQPAGGVQDHQSIVGAPYKGSVPNPDTGHVLVYCVARGLQGGVVFGGYCSSSFDGGLSWTPLAPGFPVGTAQCNGQHHHLRADAAGRIYRGAVGCGGATVYRSDDGGLTWTEHPIPKATGVTGHDVAVDVDAAGNVHAVWNGADGLLYLASSRDRAATWTAPRVVSPPNVEATAFSTVAAGSAGRVAVGYLGTDDSKLPGVSSTKWHGYISIVLDSFDPQAPVGIVRVNDKDTPLFTGVCQGNTKCGAFGDFIDSVVDPGGRVFVAMAQSPPGTGIVATLRDGPSLRVAAANATR